MGNATPGMIAAVDLGSNSFHMIVAKTDEDSFHVVDRMRDMVQLAAGLDQDNNITDKAIVRAIECLERFGDRLSDLPPSAVRAVGTNTLRKARNAPSFLSQAETVLGHSIACDSSLRIFHASGGVTLPMVSSVMAASPLNRSLPWSIIAMASEANHRDSDSLWATLPQG